jgi:hypothetical protein
MRSAMPSSNYWRAASPGGENSPPTRSRVEVITCMDSKHYPAPTVLEGDVLDPETEDDVQTFEHRRQHLKWRIYPVDTEDPRRSRRSQNTES